ncbi:hypothetical protein SOCE26_000150 [Sorangium cellulosum]|uniref:GYF domain-containing protein n=1 Tax=Sorangium cellulosum TaxID=56 RepID=A0A2L0EH80_SORCE|nr:DUF4339 domain-containing protein [Sorangium cellulosum]AUX38638.1 hypothetical protein SOCE26_000150 [Sorangium cellulosum]
MRSVKLFDELLSAERGFPDRWYVSNGEQSVGPVSLDQLARGIERGIVPLDSFVRNEAWTVWCPLSDIAMVTVAASGAPAQRPDEPFPSDDEDVDPPSSTQPLTSTRHAPPGHAAGHPGAAPR